MTVSTADVRAAMIDTIARFLEAARDPAPGWTTPRDGAEKLAASLLRASPAAGIVAAAPAAIAPLAATRSLHQFRQQATGALVADAPLPAWAACADDHCRTTQACVHGNAAGNAIAVAGTPSTATRVPQAAMAPAPVVSAPLVPATNKAELAPAT